MSGILTAFIGRVSAATDAFFNLVTLLLPGNGTNGAQNNTFLDSSTNNFTITRNGNTTQGTFSPFSQTGWSVYLNGSSSFTTPAGLQTAFAGWGGRTRSWETFVFRSDSADYTLQAAYAGVSANGRWFIYITGSKLGFYWTTSTSTQAGVVSTASIPLGWSHLAVCVDSTTSANTTIYLGINGVIETFTGNNLSTQTSTYGWSALFSTAQFLPTSFTGYFTGLRWSDNLRYTSNYTVPTTAFTNNANTLFLLGQTNQFLDQSTNNYTITAAAGAPSVQAFSPFLPTAAYSAATVGGSGFFGFGTGSNANYLTVSGTPTAVVGWSSTATFTIECWTYISAYSFNSIIISDSNGSGTFYWAMLVNTSGKLQLYWFTTGAVTCAGNTTVNTNAWNHLAVVVTNGAISLFVNGVAQTLTGTTTIQNVGTTGTLLIGRTGSSDEGVQGFMSGLRVVKGSAVYSGAFTPPTAPPTAITNTSLLLNYTNAGITDATAKNDLQTVNDTQISTGQSKFGGSSIYFDGTNDILSVPPSPNFIFGTGDFTVEFWVYPISAVNNGIFQISTTAGGLQPSVTTTVSLSLVNNKANIYANNTNYTSTGTSVSNNTWTHLALVRASGVTRLYINGTLDTTVGTSGAITDTTNYTGSNIVLGGYYSTAYLINGFIDDFRITKFARYTSNFTAPTSAFPLQ